MSLSTFQATFWHDLWGDHAVPAGMAVYRNTVLKGCVDALLSLYPAVHRLTGDAWMQAVALDFVRRHPPASGALQHYGDGFPAAVEAALQSTGELPWLHEVALLDRCWQHSQGAADAPALDLAGLAAFAGADEARLARATLRLHPATRWHLSAQWPVFSLWQAARSAAADPNPPVWCAQGALFTRPAGAVQAVDIGAAETALLQACAEGQPVGVALAAAHAADPTGDAGVALARLLTHGAFTGAMETSSS